MQSSFVLRSACRSGAVLAITLAACSGDQDPATAAPPLAGEWIRVYPPDGALDTLILHDDGRVGGSTAGLDSSAYRFIRWKVGDPLMPGGFCVGEGDRGGKHLWACQGFRLVGDTLALANQNRTVFLRVPADGHVVASTPWASPSGEPPAPRPGDSVKAIPPLGTR